MHEHTADDMIWIAAAVLVVVLAVLFYIRRQFALLAVSIISVVVVIVWQFASGVSQTQGLAKDSVSASVGLSDGACLDPSRDLAITVLNSAERSVRRVSLSLTGKLSGQDAIAYRGSVREGQLIPPGETHTRCYQPLYHGFVHPRPDVIDVTLYEWQIEVTVVNFDGAESN